MARVRPGMTQPRQKANAGDNWQLGNRKIKIDALSHACIQRMQISLPQGQRHMLGREVCTLRRPPLTFVFFHFFHFFYFFAELDKIEQNWSFTFWLSQLHFLIDFNHLKKNWAQLETNWGLLGKIGQIWEKLGGFWVVLGKFVTNWVAFGQNWANLRKIGGLLGKWEKLGLHSRLFYVIFFQLPHQAQLHIELQNAYPAGRCLI